MIKKIHIQNTRPWSCLGLFICLLGVSGVVHANQADDEQDVEVIIVTASTPTPGDKNIQGAKIDVLEGLQKQLREGASLGQTLSHLAGVRVLDTGNNAGVPVIRGLTGNRIRILSNGMAVDHQQYGIRHQPNVDPFLSSRIEIVRGASSLMYGSDAIGGVIDVIGLDVGFSYNQHIDTEMDLRLDYASNNEQGGMSFKGSSFGENWGIAAGFTAREGQEISTPDEPTAFETGIASDPAFTGELPFTDFNQVNGQVAVAWLFEEDTKVSLRYNRWDNEQNYLQPNPPAGKGLGVWLQNDEVQLSVEHGISINDTKWLIKPTLSWQNNSRQASSVGNTLSDGFDGTVELEFDQYAFRIDARHDDWLVFDGGTIGFEVKTREQVSRGLEVLSPGGEQESLGIFAFEERRFGNLLLQAGMRYDYIEVTGDAQKTAAPATFTGRVSNNYDVLSGSVGGSYQLNRQWTLAANIGSGFRAPTLFELFAQGIHGGVAAVQLGNSDLAPEESINTDFAIRWRKPNASASVTIYHNQIDDFIYLEDTFEQATNGLPIFRNEQTDARLQGIEFEGEYSLNDYWSVRLIADMIATENTLTGEDLPLTPANEVLGELTWQPNSLLGLSEPYVRFEGKYADAKDAALGEPFQQFDRNPNFGSASTDSYWLANISAGGFIPLNDQQELRVNLAVLNMFDEPYRDFLNTYKAYALNPGMDIRLTLQMTFN
ncbi:TonB-dependent receptor [Glaciecola sp. SC05]|uniref:TonB-dependent receptor n=1 Tax=Glaciecola sp. SC05 TaxID=1987355 RepID=UPI0035297DA3